MLYDNALVKIVEGWHPHEDDFGGMQTLEIAPSAALSEAPWVWCGAAPGLADCWQAAWLAGAAGKEANGAGLGGQCPSGREAA